LGSGNLPEDAVYPAAKNDGEGKALNGANEYVLHFAKAEKPPVNAFWSLTMYDAESYLVPNPINRYALGDRSGMKAGDDGSLTIYIHKEVPSADKKSNWLPAPDGPIFLVMRLYWPKETPPSILPPGEGTWRPPPIEVAQ
jgi:hypothetical protein